ncbi:unnamed protein product [Lasius platythorax]|uniref:RPGRIP1 C-terminal domain-containing protein n=1 Tax=Lasius platythorax TaxID=488582 RepID=A0AAV2N4Q4_9HYME
MADDPNRDILPVKEGSCADTIISGIDPRERHLVCKLDRYQLEDKYLRLLDEASNLKKLSNCQEDKIKRLGTKLIRLASNPRSCGLALDVADDKSRTAALELENTKLKEKIAVMRNQLLSHTMSGRSSSRSRNLVRPSSSGFVTCRSENNRTRVPSCQCIVGAGDDDNDMRNCLLKIEKLEAQKKDMTCRITELEKELTLSANTQREKVAENVEYIRVWRQMKQLNDKLMTAQEKNAALTTEINDLKTTLEQTTKNNQEIAAILTSERTRIAEIDHHMLKAKNSELTLREKDEQIRDFMSEIKILQQHNNELISLTSKYGQVEFENIELRKKLSENAQDQQTLKTTFNNEQANIVTLKATNERLLAKLQELQTNIDTLTVQVASFYKQNGKCDAVASKMTLSDVKQCMKCCEMYDKIMQLEKVGNTQKSLQLADKSIQTIIITASIKEQSTMTRSEEKRNEEKASLQSPLKEWKTSQETNGTNVLSREKILKLLDQAQINTPLDASRITSKEEYTGILDVAQRHSDGEISSQLLHDELNPESSRKGLVENPNITLNQMFLILFDVLQEYMSFNNVDETFSSHQVSTIKNPLIDVNNNNLSVITTRGIKQNCLSADAAENLESDCRCALQSITAVDTKDCKNLACEKKSATVLMKDTCSSMKDALDVNLFPKIHEKCRKSSYRDISKDFCAEKTVKKLKRLKSPRCNLTCHFRKLKDPLSLEEKQKLPCRIECLDDSMKLTACPTECFPLLISDSQGLIEIHISRLQLSTSVAKIPEEEDICNLYIYISWDIWGEKTAYTPRMKCPNLIFNSSSVYRIADLSSFFKNVLSEYLVFRVNIVRRNDTSYTLARAKVSIKDILDYPQNKLHYIVPVSSVISCFFGVNFGQLSLWVRLSCNVDMVEAFKKQCGITSLRDVPLHVPSIRKDTNDVPQESFVPHPSVKVEDARPKDQDLKDRTIREESKELHIQSPLDIKFEYETENSEDENYLDNSNNEDFASRRDGTNRISEEDKRITARCPDSDALTDSNNVETQRQRRDTLKDSSSMKEFRTLIENHLEKDTIIIEIASMQLLNESFIMQDDEIHLLYVEYSFLGRRGEDMETVSVEKPKTASQEMFYNFKKKFRIDEKTHSVERNILRSMLAESTSPNVKFIIISEPLPEETEVKECEEVGYAIFNIKKYALGDGSRDVSLPIKDDRNRQIGTLKIVVSGFDAIRQCLSDVKAIKQLG